VQTKSNEVALLPGAEIDPTGDGDAGPPPRGAARGRDLTQGPILKTMLLFALPTLGASALQTLNSSINAIWVGRILGERALAATANGNIMMSMLMVFVLGFGMAATILIGQAVGRRDLADARRTLGTTFGFFTIAIVLLSALAWEGAPTMLRWMATPADSYMLALAYLRVIFLAMPGTLLMTLMMTAIRGTGDSMTPLWFMGLSVALDGGLNPVLILGLGPAPRLGIAGSATATLIANYTAFASIVAYSHVRDLPLRLRGAEWRYLRPDLALLGVIVRKGGAMGLQMIVITSSAVLMMGLANRYGVATVAAYGVTQQLWIYVSMPATALSMAVSTMVAQNIGAGHWDRVSRITAAGLWCNLAGTGAAVLLLTLADRELASLFLGAHSPSVPIAGHIQLIASWGFIFYGAALILFGTVRANGEVVWPLIILTVAMYGVRVGMGFGLQHWLGADAIWLSFSSGMVATALMATILYLHGGWRRKSMIGRR
jgi:putative MATE family efflux protein